MQAHPPVRAGRGARLFKAMPCGAGLGAVLASCGAHVGVPARADRTPIAIEGLWGSAFGNGINDQPANTLFYGAGAGNGTRGVYGGIDPR